MAFMEKGGDTFYLFAVGQTQCSSRTQCIAESLGHARRPHLHKVQANLCRASTVISTILSALLSLRRRRGRWGKKVIKQAVRREGGDVNHGKLHVASVLLISAIF